jgi:hypothetical protein
MVTDKCVFLVEPKVTDRSEVQVKIHDEACNYSMEVEEREEIQRILNAGGQG